MTAERNLKNNNAVVITKRSMIYICAFLVCAFEIMSFVGFVTNHEYVYPSETSEGQASRNFTMNETVKNIFMEESTQKPQSQNISIEPMAEIARNISLLDMKCPFRHSKLYRKVYVYEHPEHGPLSMRAPSANDTLFEEWPWTPILKDSSEKEYGHFGMGTHMDQFSLEIIVNEIFTNPLSCLRTFDPESALLFYVPFFNSVHFHAGKVFPENFTTTKYAQAMIDLAEHKFETWENVWGITSKYWKRRGGTDHISVMPEPFHGFSHSRSRRGNYHYVNSQLQLAPHIVISVELSKTFIEMYPKCAAKNIVVPYPNPDGRHYNGFYNEEAITYLQEKLDLNLKSSIRDIKNKGAPSKAEMKLWKEKSKKKQLRPVAVYYTAGRHGSCRNLRAALGDDYQCSPSGLKFYNELKPDKRKSKIISFQYGMRMSTFCPCPGGDSPSAKRMYDAVMAGCIPVILSEDFAWALSTETDLNSSYPLIDPNSFSIRLNADQFTDHQVDKETCELKPNGFPLHSYLEDINATEIERLRKGLKKAKKYYSFYSEDPNLPVNTLQQNVLPTGGATFALIAALEQRVGGVRWPACEKEALSYPPNMQQPFGFKC